MVYILFCWIWILLLWYSFLIFKIKASLKTLPLTTHPSNEELPRITNTKPNEL